MTALRGPEAAAALVADALGADVPFHLTALERELDVPDDQRIPRPAIYLPYDKRRLGVEEWPAVLVVAQDTRNMQRIDVTDAGTVYLTTYRMRVFVFARDDDEARTDRTRKRLTLAVRDALLAGQQLDPERARVNGSTLTESYSDVDVDPANGATIAGSYIEFTVDVAELAPPLVAPTPLVGVGLRVETLPRHPAL